MKIRVGGGGGIDKDQKKEDKLEGCLKCPGKQWWIGSGLGSDSRSRERERRGAWEAGSIGYVTDEMLGKGEDGMEDDSLVLALVTM